MLTRRAECERCSGCALKQGAAANKEPTNFILASLAVLGPFPFYCHEAFDWQDGKSDKLTISQMQETGKVFRLCQGWVQEVRKLAATGYYKDSPAATKVYALTAKVHLEEFKFLCSLKRDTPEALAMLKEEKQREAKGLQAILKALLKKRAKYQPVD